MTSELKTWKAVIGVDPAASLAPGTRIRRPGQLLIARRGNVPGEWIVYADAVCAEQAASAIRDSLRAALGEALVVAVRSLELAADDIDGYVPCRGCEQPMLYDPDADYCPACIAANTGLSWREIAAERSEGRMFGAA